MSQGKVRGRRLRPARVRRSTTRARAARVPPSRRVHAPQLLADKATVTPPPRHRLRKVTPLAATAGRTAPTTTVTPTAPTATAHLSPAPHRQTAVTPRRAASPGKTPYRTANTSPPPQKTTRRRTAESTQEAAPPPDRTPPTALRTDLRSPGVTRLVASQMVLPGLASLRRTGQGRTADRAQEAAMPPGRVPSTALSRTRRPRTAPGPRKGMLRKRVLSPSRAPLSARSWLRPGGVAGSSRGEMVPPSQTSLSAVPGMRRGHVVASSRGGTVPPSQVSRSALREARRRRAARGPWTRVLSPSRALLSALSRMRRRRVVGGSRGEMVPPSRSLSALLRAGRGRVVSGPRGEVLPPGRTRRGLRWMAGLSVGERWLSGALPRGAGAWLTVRGSLGEALVLAVWRVACLPPGVRW